MTSLGPARTPSTAWDADDEHATSTDDDRPIIPRKRRLGRRDPIVIGPSSTTRPSTSRARLSSPSSSSSALRAPPALRRAPLPFELGSDADNDVERVTAQRVGRTTAAEAGLTVEAFLKSGTVQSARAGKGKAYEARLKRGEAAGQPAGKGKKSMDPTVHSQPLGPGRTRTRRVRQPSGLETPLRALRLFSPPSSPIPLFDHSAKRKSIASSSRAIPPTGLSRSTTRARPDFGQFPRFPQPVPSAPSSSSPHTPRKKATKRPTRALSEWGWGLDFGAGRSGPSEGETTTAAAADVLADVEMLDGRPPSRRARTRAKARGKVDGTPVRGPTAAQRNGLPELQMVAREEDEDEDEPALADSPSRRRLLFGAPAAVPVQHAPANPQPLRLVPTPKLVRNPRPRPFELRSAPIVLSDDDEPANQSEDVVELRTTGRPTGAQIERSSTIAEPDSVVGQSAASGPPRSSSARPPTKTSTIAASTSPLVSTPTRTRRASNGATSRPLSDLVDSLMDAPHTTAVRARFGRARVEGIPVWRGASARGIELVSTDVRSWSAGGGTREARSATVVAEGTSSVGRPRTTSEPTIDNPSFRARAPAAPTGDNTTIHDGSSDCAPGAGRQAAGDPQGNILVPSSSTESLEGGMSLMPDDDGIPDVTMVDLDELDQGAQVSPQRPATHPARRSAFLGSDDGLGALLDAPLILALSSDEPSASARLPPGPSMLPAAMHLGQDERWQHLTLSQAGGAAGRSPPSDPVPSARAFRALAADPGAPSTGQQTTVPSAYTYRLETIANPVISADAPPGPLAPPMRPPDQWPLGDGMVGLTDMLEYERELFAGDPTRDDMDLDLDGPTDDDPIAVGLRADALDKSEAAQSPPTSEDARFSFAGPPSPSRSLPSLHFVSSASAAPSTPPPTPPLLPQLQDGPPARKTKGILRSSSPLTEVDSDKTAGSESARARRSKTVTFAPEGDEREVAAPSRRERSAPPSLPAGGTLHSLSNLVPAVRAGSNPPVRESPPLIPSYQAPSTATTRVQATFISATHRTTNGSAPPTADALAY